MKFTALPQTALLAGLLLALGLAPLAAQAQSSPSSEQIVNSLKPHGTDGVTRGIRIGTQGQQAVPDAKPSASLNVLFASGSADLTPAATHTLDELGKALTDARLAGNKFRIEGHTDTVGTPEQNKTLSDRRAKTVADYLSAKYSLGGDRIEAVGMGEDGLLIPTAPQTPEQRNRRVVVVNLGG